MLNIIVCAPAISISVADASVVTLKSLGIILLIFFFFAHRNGLYSLLVSQTYKLLFLFLLLLAIDMAFILGKILRLTNCCFVFISPVHVN